MLRRAALLSVILPATACALVAGIEDVTEVSLGEPDAAPDDDAAPERDTGGPDPDVVSPTDGGEGGCSPTSTFGAPMPIASLNTASQESTPRFSLDELEVYFGSDRPGHIGASSIYSARRPSIGAAFATPALVPNVNSTNPAVSVYHPAITGDALSLFSQVGPGANPTDLYVATRGTTLADFGTPQVVANVGSAQFEYIPFVTPDGSRLLFSSNRGGSFRLYEAVRNGANFGAATIIAGIAPPGVNDSETAPVLSSDLLTIYFGSTRNDANAAYHIWVARRTTPTGTFGTPTAVTELNSTAANISDLPSFISTDHCRLYMSSNRTTGSGGYDVYVATRTQ